MYKASNQAAFCWTTEWIRLTNLNMLRNLCEEIFRPKQPPKIAKQW